MKTTASAPATRATPTAARVQRTLQRSAARTARPASRAAKLDCEKVGTRPSQSTATRAVRIARSRRSCAQSSADIAITITSAR